MNTQEVISYLDELLFSQTGKHLDSLQVSILKGVLNGQKYTDIAQDYNCTAGHAKDKAYELWQLLSEVLDEDINKSNFRATIERLGIANNNSKLFNSKRDKFDEEANHVIMEMSNLKAEKVNIYL